MRRQMQEIPAAEGMPRIDFSELCSYDEADLQHTPKLTPFTASSAYATLFYSISSYTIL